MLTAVTLEGLAEALSFVRAGGLQPEALLDALEADPSRSEFVSEKLSAMVKGNFEGGTPIRHLFRDLQLALKLSGSNPAVPATGVVAGLLFGAMKRGWAASDGAIISRAFEPDPPAQTTPKTEPVAVAPAAPVSEPAPPEVQLMATTEGPVETPAESASEPAPTSVDVPSQPMASPARSGMIRETHGGHGSKPRPGLELLHTTPVTVGGPLKPTTTPAPPATPPKTPVTPPPTILPVRASMPPNSGVKIRSTNTGSVPLPPFPAAPPESPHFPVNMPHRVNRRLSDTTNLQALLQSELAAAGAKPAEPTPASEAAESTPDEIAESEPVEEPLVLRRHEQSWRIVTKRAELGDPSGKAEWGMIDVGCCPARVERLASLAARRREPRPDLQFPFLFCQAPCQCRSQVVSISPFKTAYVCN
jgi:hypothetical protein